MALEPRRGGLEEIIQVLAAVRRIADQRVRPQIHDEVEVLQRQLADEDRCAVGDFHDVHRAVSSLDGQPHSVVHGALGNPDAAPDRLLITPAGHMRM